MRSVYDGYVEVCVLYFRFFYVEVFLRFNEGV